MRNECNIIRDLLPIYIEGMASADSQEYVREHLEGCDACRAEADAMRSMKLPDPGAGVPMARMQKQLRGKYARIIAITAAFVLAAAVALFAQLTQPIYLSREEACESLSAVDTGNNGTIGTGGQIVLNFTDKVTRFSCDDSYDPDTHAVEYSVTAWTSIWDRLFLSDRMQRLILSYDGGPTAIYYSSNDGEADELLHAENYEPQGGRITLPRLALAYYLVIAAALAGALILLRLLFGRFEGARRWLDALWPAPAAYLLGHFAVRGLSVTSHNLPRDFVMILLAAVMIYCALVCLRSLVRMQLQKRQDMAQ